jgi:dihydrofolate reductase
VASRSVLPSFAARDRYIQAGAARGLAESHERLDGWLEKQGHSETTGGGRRMRKLIESTQVSLGGEVGSPQEWAFPYLNEEHFAYASKLLLAADALLLGRRTYEGLSAAYPRMTSDATGVQGEFIDRMNSIPKYVASTTLGETTWNATVIDGDVADYVAELKKQPGGNIVKYGTGPLDATLMDHGLIDEFHLLVTPVAVGRGQHLFEDISSAPQLNLADVTRFSNGVVILVYTPK